MPVIEIPLALQKFTKQQKTITVGAATVQQALVDLTHSYPELTSHLYSDQTISPFLGIYLNQRLIQNPLSCIKPLAQHDIIRIVVAVSGG